MIKTQSVFLSSPRPLSCRFSPRASRHNSGSHFPDLLLASARLIIPQRCAPYHDRPGIHDDTAQQQQQQHTVEIPSTNNIRDPIGLFPLRTGLSRRMYPGCVDWPPCRKCRSQLRTARMETSWMPSWKKLKRLTPSLRLFFGLFGSFSLSF